MAEELKHLIEQIQKEGVEKAQKEADALIKKAKTKADKITAKAEEKAEKTRQKAEADAEAFAQRSIKTLEQAARDLLITVGQGCEKVITETLGQATEKALSGDLLEKMILRVVEQHPDESLELHVSEKDKKGLVAFCTQLASKKKQTIELVSDAEVLNGFKLGFKDKSVYLDFSGEAIAESLASFLRPELAKIVSGVAQEEVNA
jgi:V/A-type H+-transporting ATPase subunit E